MDKTNKSNKYIDAYVWVSHGNNVSAHHNYYKFETKFKYLTFYSTPFQTIDTNTLQYLDSCKIITYSSGQVKGNNIDFEVVFECFICCPIEGMLIQTVAKNITKAGIRGESVGENPSPVIIFITRDHHYMNAYFSTIEEGDTFVCRIIGQRFELNDKYVSIIAELVEPKKDLEPTTFKPKLVFEE